MYVVGFMSRCWVIGRCMCVRMRWYYGNMGVCIGIISAGFLLFGIVGMIGGCAIVLGFVGFGRRCC